ncbi:ACP S-malonyltransferase [Thermoactinospora rubra]|uniref:ACP S-malonyltransferase n=1 Tax=Thermoactinospora rubra TaxID=1088767 RepID=UPI001F0A69B1|nr:hypothetical protein [Thermoactinospora rubra]
MSATAVVFPGMGPIRFADVGRFLVVNPVARKLVAEADARLGYPLLERLRSSEGDYTEYAQVAFFVSCVALARWADEEYGEAPAYATGPSFGEKPLAAYVGALSFSDGVWMTSRLARCLEEYFASEHQDVVTHSFVRVPRERVVEMLAELPWSEISCYIDRDFHMVTLRERHLDRLTRQIRANGGLSLYTMRPPMHASAFGALRRKAEDEVIGKLTFAEPALPVIADQDGAVLRTGEEIREMLLKSFVQPLRWPDVVGALKRLDVGAVRVCGPDSLFGRVAVTRQAFEVVAVNPRTALQPRAQRATA